MTEKAKSAYDNTRGDPDKLPHRLPMPTVWLRELLKHHCFCSTADTATLVRVISASALLVERALDRTTEEVPDSVQEGRSAMMVFEEGAFSQTEAVNAARKDTEFQEIQDSDISPMLDYLTPPGTSTETK